VTEARAHRLAGGAPVAPVAPAPAARPALPSPGRRGADPAAAEEFIRLFHAEHPGAGRPGRRLAEVRASIAEHGTYRHTLAELAFGARVAWRNSKKCIGRLYWKSLSVRDCRHVTTPLGMYLHCVSHLRLTFNGGRIRPMVTVFPPAGPDGAGPRIHNEQLVRYAGYRRPDATVIGDPSSVALTDAAGAAGWHGGRGTAFDPLPLLIETPEAGLRVFDLPPEVVRNVPIEHPTLPWFGELGLRWYAVPAVADMTLEIGGIHYTAAPFNGWYMGTEIGARNLADVDRYDMLPEIAGRMRLDTSGDHTLWKDRALVELNVAVLWSYRRAGVAITDHHTESSRFLLHIRREERQGRRVPADWSWIVPPMSAATTAVFHRYYDETDLRPNYLREHER